MNAKKQYIRKVTRILFKKRGMCEKCKCKKVTTWHHKNYKLPNKLRRKDLQELCIECHRKIEDKLKYKQIKGNKLKREFRR